MAVFILDVPILFEIETEWTEETFSGFIDCETIQQAVGLSLYPEQHCSTSGREAGCEQ